ncbi:hypothetical protein, partial [Bacteroides fragilis]|uniref:hypothetical protein n=1 Tax=Bacteroides fragilis TaxID=817 RepID=UPI001955B3B6
GQITCSDKNIAVKNAIMEGTYNQNIVGLSPKSGTTANLASRKSRIAANMKYLPSFMARETDSCVFPKSSSR